MSRAQLQAYADLEEVLQDGCYKFRDPLEERRTFDIQIKYHITQGLQVGKYRNPKAMIGHDDPNNRFGLEHAVLGMTILWYHFIRCENTNKVMKSLRKAKTQAAVATIVYDRCVFRHTGNFMWALVVRYVQLIRMIAAKIASDSVGKQAECLAHLNTIKDLHYSFFNKFFDDAPGTGAPNVYSKYQSQFWDIVPRSANDCTAPWGPFDEFPTSRSNVWNFYANTFYPAFCTGSGIGNSLIPSSGYVLRLE